MKISELKPESLSTHLYYGANHMVRIGRASAEALLKGVAPQMGYTTDVARCVDEQGFDQRLMVQNISGDYYLASTSTPIDQWPQAFGVTVKRYLPREDEAPADPEPDFHSSRPRPRG